MKILNAWNKTLQDETGGQLKLGFYSGGSQGDERDLLRKMRVGQLDGGLVSMAGMSMLVRQMLVLVLPNFLDTYEKLDRVRLEMGEDFEKMFEEEGFVLVAWGDAGKSRLFSRRQVVQPSDLKSMRPWLWKDDLVVNEFYDVIGVTGVRLGVPEVYPGLQTKMVDVVVSSALAAIAMQWHTRVKYATADSAAIIVGGMLVRKDKVASLKPELRRVFLRTAKRAETLLNRVIRRDDQKAYDVILRKGIVATDTSAHKRQWDDVAREVQERLTGRVFSRELFEAVRAAARE